ncbi:hypothetical protein PSFL107428_03375 [Pseudoalteromonas maricaloris]
MATNNQQHIKLSIVNTLSRCNLFLASQSMVQIGDSLRVAGDSRVEIIIFYW